MIEHGKIDSDVYLDGELTLHGMVTGTITVVDGGMLTLHGVCCRNLVVEKGAQAFLHGTVGGNVLNSGGHLEVYGSVDGYLRTADDGNTLIAPSAVVNEGSG